MLGMPWDEVNAEACMLEHAISERVEDRLVELLGNPQTCPHGHPVPPRDLTVPVRSRERRWRRSTAAAKRSCAASASRCPRSCAIWERSDCAPARRFAIVEKAPLGGPVTVEIGGDAACDFARTRAHGDRR